MAGAAMSAPTTLAKARLRNWKALDGEGRLILTIAAIRAADGSFKIGLDVHDALWWTST